MPIDPVASPNRRSATPAANTSAEAQGGTQTPGSTSRTGLAPEVDSVESVRRGTGAPAIQQPLAAALASQPQGGQQPNRRGPDTIVFLGMGDHTNHEARRLREAGHRVRYVGDVNGNDVVTIQVRDGSRTRRQRFDLTTQADRQAFAAALGLGGERAERLTRLLAGARDNAADELAMLALAMAEAEAGQLTMERLVLSGHSTGRSVWGSANGSVLLSEVGELAAIFPRAAAQVEDVKMAACYSAGESQVERFKEMFPNMATFWAYTTSAPGTWVGAMDHLLVWAQNTRGANQDGRIERARTRNARHRKGNNVAVWSTSRGYHNGRDGEALGTIQRLLRDQASTFDAFHAGTELVEHTQRGPLRDYYNLLQRAVQRNDLSSDQRESLELQRERTIRLIFFDARVKGRFAREHAAAIRAGYAAVGEQAPDFANLSRAETLAEVERFANLVWDREVTDAAARDLVELLREGLVGLHPDIVPAHWI